MQYEALGFNDSNAGLVEKLIFTGAAGKFKTVLNRAFNTLGEYKPGDAEAIYPLIESQEIGLVLTVDAMEKPSITYQYYGVLAHSNKAALVVLANVPSSFASPELKMEEQAVSVLLKIAQTIRQPTGEFARGAELSSLLEQVRLGIHRAGAAPVPAFKSFVCID